MPLPGIQPGKVVNARKYGFTHPGKNRGFFIVWVDLPAQNLAALGPDPLGKLTDMELDNFKKDGRLKVIKQQNVTHQGMQGREFRLEGAGNDIAIARVFVAPHARGGATAYVLGLEGQNLKEDNPDVTRFFESFRAEDELQPRKP